MQWIRKSEIRVFLPAGRCGEQGPCQNENCPFRAISLWQSVCAPVDQTGFNPSDVFQPHLDGFRIRVQVHPKLHLLRPKHLIHVAILHGHVAKHLAASHRVWKSRTLFTSQMTKSPLDDPFLIFVSQVFLTRGVTRFHCKQAHRDACCGRSIDSPPCIMAASNQASRLSVIFHLLGESGKVLILAHMLTYLTTPVEHATGLCNDSCPKVNAILSFS